MSIDQHFDGLLNQHQARIDKADSNRVLREESLRRSAQELKSLTWEQTANNLIKVYESVM